MQTKQAKEIIKHEVATNGVVTSKAIKIYCEHRISKTTFDKLVEHGLRKYKTRNSKKD
jgi:hypothetical protein